jgi:hypothetical protein
VWCGRWVDVDEVMRALGVIQPGVPVRIKLNQVKANELTTIHQLYIY